MSVLWIYLQNLRAKLCAPHTSIGPIVNRVTLEVLIALNVSIINFRFVTPYGLVSRYRCFGVTFCEPRQVTLHSTVGMSLVYSTALNPVRIFVLILYSVQATFLFPKTSKPSPGPTQHRGFLPRVNGRVMNFMTSFHLMPTLRMIGAIP